MARTSKGKYRILELEILEDRFAPAVYTVNNLTDNGPAPAGMPGYSQDACSLRWAINNMNIRGDAANTINITDVGGLGGQIPLGSTLEISANVQIVGPGQNVVSVVRANGLDDDLLFSDFLVDPGKSVQISGLTIANGRAATGGGINSNGNLTLSNDTLGGNVAVGSDGVPAVGGAIAVFGANLRMSGCTVNGTNQADVGGGVFIEGSTSAASSSVFRSTAIQNNQAESGGGIAINGNVALTLFTTSVTTNNASYSGGGIWMRGAAAVLTLSDQSSVSSNVVPQSAENDDRRLGGGIYNGGGAVNIGNRITIDSNRAALGGGIYNLKGSVLQLAGEPGGSSLSVSGNSARFNGGGIRNNGGTITLTGVTINNNRATGAAPDGIGGGIYSSGTAANPAEITLTNSTISNDNARRGAGISNDGNARTNLNGAMVGFNTATSPDGTGLAGGIYDSNGGTVDVINSTLADNSADSSGGAIYAQAGSTVFLTNDTIADNTATTAGGVYLEVGADVSVGNSTIALNTDAAGTPDVTGAFNSQGNNLIGNTAGGSGWLGSDLLNEDPMLLPLGYYGGDTETMPPTAGSPAIDAGNNALAVDANGNSLATDQRGFTRIVNGTVDIGAVEVQANEAGVVNISLDFSENPATYGDDVTLSATVSAAYSSSGAPTGSVDFYDGTTDLGTGTIVSGVASISVDDLTVGDHTVTAVYSGDGTFNSQTSDPSDLTVLQATPTINWSNPADITYGTLLDGTQLNATATFGGTTVAGTFTYDQPAGTMLSAGAGQALSVTFVPTDTTDFTNATQFVLINVDQAPLTITASNVAMTYADGTTLNGDAGFTESGLQSSDAIDSVTLATTATTSGSGNWNAGGWTITPSAAVGVAFNPSNYSITYVAGNLTVNTASLTITGVSGTDKPYDGGLNDPITGTANLQGHVTSDDVSLIASGASASFADPNVGTAKTVSFVGYTITGTDAANYTLSQPADSTASINPYALTVNVGNDSQSYGSPANFAADLPATIDTAVNCENLAITYSSSGNNTTANPGTYAITATLSDGTGLLSNYSITLTNGTLTVNQVTPTVNVTSSQNPATYGQTVTFTALVTPPTTGNATPTGTIAFYVDGNLVDGTYTLDDTGAASFAISDLSVGTHAITASYSGDGNFNAVSADPLTQYVFTISDK